MNATTATQTASTPVSSLPVGTRWVMDASHSHVSFSVRHMMISNVRGEFGKASGEATYDAQHPEQSRVNVSVDVASINTREEKRDAHLRSADFFDVANHRGTTREVKLAVEEITSEHTDPWGNQRIGASARTKIRRSDFGMRWNAALEAGGVLVGDDVTIQLEVELIRQK